MQTKSTQQRIAEIKEQMIEDEQKRRIAILEKYRPPQKVPYKCKQEKIFFGRWGS